MNGARKSFAIEVARFRKWAATLTAPLHGEWECEYSDWSTFFTAIDRFIADADLLRLTADDIDRLLYCLARDNEREDVAELIGARADLLFVLARQALASNESDAKWQLAVLLGDTVGRRDEAEILLLELVRDSDEYVSRRALLALSRLGSDQTEVLAERAWATGHEYQRIAALWALHAVASPRLAEFTTLAKKDGRQYILQNADELTRSNAST